MTIWPRNTQKKAPSQAFTKSKKIYHIGRSLTLRQTMDCLIMLIILAQICVLVIQKMWLMIFRGGQTPYWNERYERYTYIYVCGGRGLSGSRTLVYIKQRRNFIRFKLSTWNRLMLTLTTTDPQQVLSFKIKNISDNFIISSLLSIW